MREFIQSIRFNTPIEHVWQMMCDVEHWHEWTASISRVEIRRGGPLRIGSRVVIKQPKFQPATWNVTSLMPGNRFACVSGGPGVLVTAHHEIVGDADACKVTLRQQFTDMLSGLFAGLTADINERYWAMEAEGLRTRCGMR